MLRTNNKGYLYEKIKDHPLAYKDGVVFVHRRVWFEANGPIPKGGIIHHINEIKTDNRIENLELCTRSSHMKIHKKDGFGVESWNKGTAEYQVMVCANCKKQFTRESKEVRKSLKRSERIVCSRSCSKAYRGPLNTGWTKHKTGKYQATYRNKYIGLFDTPEAAAEAYRNARALSESMGRDRSAP